MRKIEAFLVLASVTGCFWEKGPTPRARPDLTAELVSPGALVAGETFTVSVTIRNPGPGWAPPSRAGVFFSTGVDLEGDSAAVGLVDIGSVPPGDERETQAELTAPALLEGEYYVCVAADGPGEILETNEANNVSSDGPVGLSLPPVPDVVPGKLSPDVWAVEPGGSFQLERGVANLGGADAPAFEWEVYLSPDEALSGGDILIASGSLSSLAAGAVEVGASVCTVPGGTTEGSYYIGLIVDSLGDVAEFDEDNNVRWTPYRMLVGQAAPGRNLAVVVGVSDYMGVGADLTCCDDDAVQFAAILGADRLRWETGHIRVLTDAEATGAVILQAIAEMRDLSAPGDRCVFSFSGHGMRVPDDDSDELDGYDEALVPHDFDYITDDELALEFGAFTGRTLSFVMDTCFSGGMAKGLGDAKGLPGDGFAEDLLRASWVKDLDNLVDVVVLSASDDDEYAYEDPSLGHAVFVYFLLEGMLAPEADADEDGLLSAEELFDYAAPRTTAYQHDQHPQLYDAHAGEIELTNVPSPAANLRAEGAGAFAPWARPGENVVVRRSFSNAGPVRCTAVLHSLYLSADAKFDGSDVHLHSFRTPVFEPGESMDGWVTAQVPPALATGFCRVALVLDPDDTVAELNEADNVVFSDGGVFVGTEDAFEDDGSPSSAAAIATGEVQQRTFLPSPDVDWLSVNITDTAPTYTFETLNLVGATDTVLRLYDTDGLALLAENDDVAAGDYSSRIDHVFAATGTYYLQVKEFRGSPGAYSVKMTGP